MLKINRRTHLQQSLEMRVSFIILSYLCLFVLPFASLSTFFSHVATFPCPPRLNQYLAENGTLQGTSIEPSHNSNP